MAQIKVYAGDETSRKWDVICSRFTSKTAAFAAMVEQYYEQLLPIETEGESDEQETETLSVLRKW